MHSVIKYDQFYLGFQETVITTLSQTITLHMPKDTSIEKIKTIDP